MPIENKERPCAHKDDQGEDCQGAQVYRLKAAPPGSQAAYADPNREPPRRPGGIAPKGTISILLKTNNAPCRRSRATLISSPRGGGKHCYRKFIPPLPAKPFNQNPTLAFIAVGAVAESWSP
jgi:hypothetical protein